MKLSATDIARFMFGRREHKWPWMFFVAAVPFAIPAWVISAFWGWNFVAVSFLILAGLCLLHPVYPTFCVWILIFCLSFVGSICVLFGIIDWSGFELLFFINTAALLIVRPLGRRACASSAMHT